MHQVTVEPKLSSAPPEQAARFVSIVVVCFNQARYLADAIESALTQQYGECEVLVVDDGSSDDTPAVARSFQAVRYIRQSNQGLAAARNTGLRACRGEYVAFLDADDRLLPGAIQAGIDCFRESPDAGFVYGKYRNIFDDGSAAPAPDCQPVPNRHYWHLLQSNFVGMHGTVLYRRKALVRAGAFDPSLRACEDYELYLRIARQMPIRAHDDVVAEYRHHDTNMSKDHAFMLRQVLGVLHRERQHVPDREHRRALRRGVRVWQEYYGDLLWKEWKEEPSANRLLTAFKLWPRGVTRRALRAAQQRFARYLRRPGSIRFGNLRRLEPVSRQFGFDRGQPIDRYYVESFLADQSHAIGGHVLEVGDDSYSRRFGGEKITRQDVLHVVPGSPGATIIADLSNAPHIPSDSFDCIILTQTLHYIFELDAAVATLWRILKNDGIVLATVPGISKICRDQKDQESDCWRFTASSIKRLFAERFGHDQVRVKTYGNVMTAMAFLQGLASTELRNEELAFHDPDYQVTITVAATKVTNHR